MPPDFESNLLTHIFRKFKVSEATGSDVIFAFVRRTQRVLRNFEHNATEDSTEDLQLNELNKNGEMRVTGK